MGREDEEMRRGMRNTRQGQNYFCCEVEGEVRGKGGGREIERWREWGKDEDRVEEGE